MIKTIFIISLAVLLAILILVFTMALGMFIPFDEVAEGQKTNGKIIVAAIDIFLIIVEIILVRYSIKRFKRNIS